MTIVTAAGDLASALGAGKGPSAIGNVGTVLGVAANSFSLGNSIGYMYQQGPTVNNVSQAGMSTMNLVMIGLALTQPETAPVIGLIFVGEVFYNVLTK
jgi:hypothetical protein